MGLEEFHGRWQVMTSGRADKLPMGQGQYLCIYTDAPGLFNLKIQTGNCDPVGFGDHQRDQRHQEGPGVQRIYCTVTFDKEGDYCFEAVLAAQMVNDLHVVYGHLYPLSGGYPWQGEGAVGGWSADRQGDPPVEEQ